MKNLTLFFQILFLLFFFDFIIFKKAQWLLPNESPWNYHYFFNTEYEVKHNTKKDNSKKHIIINGSSIAFYSLDRDLLEKNLQNSLATNFQIIYHAYAGMTPFDSYLSFEKINALNPSLIIYPINFVDYRLHRITAINPNWNFQNFHKESLILDAINWDEAPQSKYLFPWETLKEFYTILPFQSSTKFLASSLFGFYQWKDLYLDNLLLYFSHHYSNKNTSYHGYVGQSIPERLNYQGWTGKEFSFYPNSKLISNGFYIYIPPELLIKEPLEITFLSSQSNFKETFHFQKSGWERIILNNQFFKNNQRPQKLKITGVLSNTWQPFFAEETRKDYNFDELGIRLEQNFGLDDPSQNVYFKRIPTLEDFRYYNLNNKDYEKYFYFRLLDQPEHRPAIAYLTAIKNVKIQSSQENFSETIHFEYLKKFLIKCKEKKIPVLLINNPENPISLNWYVNSNWYKDHIIYLKSLENEFVNFVDLKYKLNMQDFSDFHHMTYLGMQKMNPVYSSEIINYLKKLKYE